MPWPLPQPADIADRAASTYETEYQRVYSLRNPGAPAVIVDARSPISTLAVHGRVLGEAAFDVYLMQSRYGQELMPDTAQDWLPRHGAIWGVPQEQPVSASGTLDLPGGQIGTVIPAGFEFSANGLGVYEVMNAGTILGAGTFAIGISAAVGGTAGDLAPGVTLTAVTPLGGLISQSGTVDSNGITGGADLEDVEQSWRPRILARIRNRGAGGDANDFEQWAQAALPGCMPYAFSPGLGEITVAIAMPVLASGQVTAWRVPTSTELSTATAYLNDATNRKPLGAPVVSVIAATLQAVNFTLHLAPDTTAIRQGISNALGLYFVGADIEIGGTLDISRSDAAIDATSGLYNFDRSAPAADVSPSTVSSLLTFGTVAFT